MSPIWMIPALVLPIGGIIIGVLLRQTAAATRELVVEIERLGEIAVGAAIVWDGFLEASATANLGDRIRRH
jgi:hypothetical protein